MGKYFMNNKKRCIVNFASIGREDYRKGSQRLLDSIVQLNLNTDFLFCTPDTQASLDTKVDDIEIFVKNRMPVSKKFGECPSHKDVPYAFKSYIIQEARDMGYEKIMWADSSAVIVKDIEKYWQLAEETGAVLFDNPGCPEATFTSDDCLEHMGCSFEFAKTFFEVDAFVIIFDFNNPNGITLFDRYFEHSRDGICLNGKSGSNRPEFKAHRHDQSIISYFAKTLNITPISYGAWSYATEDIGTKFNPTFIKTGINQFLNWPLLIELNKKGQSIFNTKFMHME